MDTNTEQEFLYAITESNGDGGFILRTKVYGYNGQLELYTKEQACKISKDMTEKGTLVRIIKLPIATLQYGYSTDLKKEIIID